jgi:hypothetical protein
MTANSILGTSFSFCRRVVNAVVLSREELADSPFTSLTKLNELHQYQALEDRTAANLKFRVLMGNVKLEDLNDVDAGYTLHTLGLLVDHLKKISLHSAHFLRTQKDIEFFQKGMVRAYVFAEAGTQKLAEKLVKSTKDNEQLSRFNSFKKSIRRIKCPSEIRNRILKDIYKELYDKDLLEPAADFIVAEYFAGNFSLK